MANTAVELEELAAGPRGRKRRRRVSWRRQIVRLAGRARMSTNTVWANLPYRPLAGTFPRKTPATLVALTGLEGCTVDRWAIRV
jgi:hypothetical protein